MTESNLFEHTVTLTKEDFGHICRCCLSRNTIGNIFQLKFDETFLVDIFKLFNTEVNWDDDLPNTICASCTATVIDLYNFKKMYDKSVATLQNISRDSKETATKKRLLLISYENHNILPLGEVVKNEDMTVEENEVIKEELSKEARNESNDQENIKDSDNNASTILEEAQKSDQTKISPRKDKYVFTLPYFCKTCDKWITATESHMHSTPRKGSHVCEICGKTYLQKAALEIHYRIHKLMLLANGESDTITEDTTKQKRKFTFQCSCDETFTSSKDLVQHKEEKNHQDPLYKNCNVCNKTIPYRGYKRHMRSMHSASSQEKFTCEYCGLTFTFKANMNRHLKIHTGEKPHVCEFCGKGFIQKIHLEEHRRGMHTGEKPFVCDFCEKAFTKKDKMKIHRRVHTGEKPYLCDHCGVTFRSSQRYNNHLKGRERNFLCNHCAKGFYTKQALDSHLISHTGETKFICHLCGNSFKNMLNLQRHEYIHTGQRPYSCKICFKTFRQQAHLFNHMRTHTGEKPYACPYCDKSFAHITTRVVHVRSHTGERPYVCDVCSKGFNHSSSMKKHRQSHFKNDVEVKLQESL